MSKIVLSSGIRGINWQDCLDAFTRASKSVGHYDNVMLSTKGKFDEALIQTDISAGEKKTTKQLFNRHLSKLTKNKKSLVNFCSDPIFIESGEAWQTLNNDRTFLFFFCSPEYFLAKCKSDELSEQELLDIWLEDSTRIWDLYVRFPENTHVINIQTVELDLAIGLKTVFDSLDIKRTRVSKSVNVNDLSSIDDFQLLSFRIAQNIYLTGLEKRSELSELYANLALVSVMANDNLTYHENDRAISGLLECKDLCSKLATVTTEQALKTAELSSTLSKQSSEHENALLQISQLQKELEFAKQNSIQQNNKNLKLETRILELESLNGEINTQFQDATKSGLQHQTRCSELVTENEFYSLQINQLKQELGAVYTDFNEVKGAKAELKGRVDSLEIQKSKIEGISEQQKGEMSKLKNRNGQLEAIRKDLISQKQSFVSTQGRLIKQIDSEALKSKELVVKHSQLEDICAELVAKNSHLEASCAEIAAKSMQQESKYNNLLMSNEVAELQISKMQEEQKVSKGTSSKIEMLESQLGMQQKQAQEELLLNTQLKSNISELKIEKELLTIQVSNLQQELEYNFAQFQKISYKKNTENNYLLDSKRLNSSLALMQFG